MTWRHTSVSRKLKKVKLEPKGLSPFLCLSLSTQKIFCKNPGVGGNSWTTLMSVIGIFYVNSVCTV